MGDAWIRVADKMPPFDEFVLVFMPLNQVAIASLSQPRKDRPMRWEFEDHYHIVQDSPITHWQPIVFPEDP